MIRRRKHRIYRRRNPIGTGADKAFVKLEKEPGISGFEAELTLLDPKTKPDAGSAQRSRDFCAKLK